MLVLCTVGALGTACFAWSELQALKKTSAPALEVVAAAPPSRPEPSRPVELSTWKGALPFGAVPAAPPQPITTPIPTEPPTEPDEPEEHPVVLDRCDANDSSDEGCSEVLSDDVDHHNIVVIVDGRRRVIEVQSELRIIDLEETIF